jgi:hypothetical protein
MEPAHHNCKVLRAELACEVECARKLVRLHADQHDHSAAGGLDHAGDAGGANAGIGLVESLNLDVDVRPERFAFGAILGEAIKRGKGIGWDRRAQPLDNVSVVVVMRRLDEHKAEAPSHAGSPG